MVLLRELILTFDLNEFNSLDGVIINITENTYIVPESIVNCSRQIGKKDAAESGIRTQCISQHFGLASGCDALPIIFCLYTTLCGNALLFHSIKKSRTVLPVDSKRSDYI